MNRLLTIIILMCAICTVAPAQDTEELKAARKWLKTGVWRNGVFNADPDENVNLVEFCNQYQKNQKQWDAVFRWIRANDLRTIPKGQHQIYGTSLVVKVEDSQNQPLEQRRSESHYKHVDFQYVVKGTEGFALLDHESSIANCEYDAKKDVIHYDYDPAKTHFFNSKKGRFNIFFPSDWHIAKVENGSGNEAIRVIVIKLDYVE